MKIHAFVPVRLNSTRLPGKSIKELAGRPLLDYVCRALLDVSQVSKVSIYASRPEIMDFAPEGCEFVQRDSALDADETLGQDIYKSFAEMQEADMYVLAHATSPFISAASVAHAVNQVRSGTFDSAATVERVQTFCWYDSQPINFHSQKRGRTQDLAPIFRETSGCYVFLREHALVGNRLGKRPYFHECLLPESIDIDDHDDWRLAEFFAEHGSLH